MRICYIADAPSTHTQKWVGYLAHKGHEIHLISPVPFEGDFHGEEFGNIALYLLKRVQPQIRIISFLIDTLSLIVQTRKLVRKIKPDILHAHYISDNGFLAAMTGFHPLVLTVWGSDVFVDPQRSPIDRYKVRFALKRADLITTSLRYTTEYIRQELLDVSPNKLKALPWGLDTNLFKKGYLNEVSMLRKNLGISDNTFTILSPRAMSEHYGIEYIVKSIPYIIEKYPDICFIFLRGFTMPPEYENKVWYEYENKVCTVAKNLGVKAYTRFVSQHLDQKEMPIYYNMCDVLISIPKTDQIGFCIHEGMACGVIPIVSNLRINLEILTDGENAFFVDRENPKDIAEKVMHCIEHPELKERFYTINRRIVEEKLDWKKNAPHMDELYLGLLKERPPK